MPRTSQQHPAHRIYPYILHILRQLTITRSNHVWAADITYIPMQRGFVYLCAILNWASRRVLAWRLSNTLTTDSALTPCRRRSPAMALRRSSTPIKGVNSLARSLRDSCRLTASKISMDGTGRWWDNVFVERLWRSLKNEEVYLRATRPLGWHGKAWPAI
jgi:putative transposase